MNLEVKFRAYYQLVIFSLLLIGEASAQNYDRGGVNVGSVDDLMMSGLGFSLGELKAVVRVLHLNDEQLEQVIAIYKDADAEIKYRRQELESAIFLMNAEMELTFDISRTGVNETEAGKKIGEWNAFVIRSEKELWENIKLIVTPEQEIYWAHIEREFERIRGAQEAVLTGEGVEMLSLLDKHWSEWEKSEAASAVIDRYVQKMDVLLSNRSEALDSEDYNNFYNLNPQQVDALYEKLFNIRGSIQSCNRRTFDELLQLMPEDKKASFEKAYYRVSLPRELFASSRIERLINAARELSNLNDEQMHEISELIHHLDRIQTEFEKQMYEALVKDEKEVAPLRVRWRKGEIPAKEANEIYFPKDHPGYAVLESRFQKQKDLFVRLKSVLDAESIHQLIRSTKQEEIPMLNPRRRAI